MNANQIAVLRFLLENANSPEVIESIRWAKEDREKQIRKFCDREGIEEAEALESFRPAKSLLERAGPGDLICYASMSQIAAKTGLRLGVIRYAIKRLKVLGYIIGSQQVWARDPQDDATEECPRLVREEEACRRNYDDYFYSPAANLYHLVAPSAMPSEEPYYVNSGEQLNLPFPPTEPRERTILAPGARLWDPFFAPVGERR